MKVLMIRSTGGLWRSKTRKMIPLCATISAHLILLLLILSWRPPAPARPDATEVSLISAVGLGKAAAPQTLAETKSTPPTPVKSKVESTPSPEVSATPPPVSKPAVPLTPPSDVTPDIFRLAFGPANLTSQPVSLSSPAPSTAADPAFQPVGGKGCQILEALKSGLQAEGEARAALLAIPRQDRSVANAILLWNGRWIDPSSVGGDAVLGPIEAMVLGDVKSAPATCQDEIMNGPRLITLADQQDTIILAFGSGTWRWADLLATISPLNQK